MKESSTPLVSVVIPCYNDWQYIHEAVDSIYNQDYKNVEIIIVDDGSDKKTKDVLNELLNENVQIFFQENSGTSAARNKGIEKAKGIYVLTLDADDYFDSSFISKGVNILEEKNKVGLVSCWLRIFKNKIIVGKNHVGGGDANSMIFTNGAIGNALFRKQCWIDVKGYDELMRKGFEDWDFNISIAKAGWGIFIIEEELFNYRDKINSRNKIANKSFKKELLKYIMIKHKDLYIINYEQTIDSFLDEIENLKRRGIVLKESKEYKIGRFLLAPLRKVKKIFSFRSKRKML